LAQPTSREVCKAVTLLDEGVNLTLVAAGYPLERVDRVTELTTANVLYLTAGRADASLGLPTRLQRYQLLGSRRRLEDDEAVLARLIGRGTQQTDERSCLPKPPSAEAREWIAASSEARGVWNKLRTAATQAVGAKLDEAFCDRLREIVEQLLRAARERIQGHADTHAVDAAVHDSAAALDGTIVPGRPFARGPVGPDLNPKPSEEPREIRGP
jgi:hypothetical protein